MCLRNSSSNESQYDSHVAVSGCNIWRSRASVDQPVITVLKGWNIFCKDFLCVIGGPDIFYFDTKGLEDGAYQISIVLF